MQEAQKKAAFTCAPQENCSPKRQVKAKRKTETVKEKHPLTSTAGIQQIGGIFRLLRRYTFLAPKMAPRLQFFIS